MSKRSIWAIIILMSAALIGVIAIQIYWINFSINLSEKKFDSNVFAALSKVAERLEYMEKEAASQDLLSQGEGGILGNLDREQLNKIGTNYLRLDYFSGTPVLKDSLVKQEYRNKQLNWELNDVLRLLGQKPIAERIDPKALDMLLNIELENRDITSEYNYGVYSRDSESFVLVNNHFYIDAGNQQVSHAGVEPELNASLADSKYRVKLFPTEYGYPGELVIHFPHRTSLLWEDTWLILLGSVLFTGLILFCFSYTIYVIFRQKKVSEMKNDFINNMTHEFKTPIATINLAADSISSPLIVDKRDQVERFASIIKQENQRMLGQVEKVLQIALIDRENLELKKNTVDLHDLIRQTAENFRLQVEERGGTIEFELDANRSNIIADETHFSNVIRNLLDNANKYSPDAPNIVLRTYNVNKQVVFEVEDHGIGMDKDEKTHIFDKFYRVHTGNLHDVKGFGLGLSYVKAMVEAHSGNIEVKSEIGEGSTFVLRIPLARALEPEMTN